MPKNPCSLKFIIVMTALVMLFSVPLGLISFYYSESTTPDSTVDSVKLSRPTTAQSPYETRSPGKGIYFVTGTIASYGYGNGQHSRFFIINTFDWLWPTHADNGPILLIWDHSGWSDGWRSEMNNRGIPFTQISANNVQDSHFDVAQYRLIIISEYQPDQYLNKMESMVSVMEDYVAHGGILIDMVGTNYQRRWSRGVPGPFGVRTQNGNDGANYVAAVGHPMVHQMNRPFFTGSSASHARITTIPTGSETLLTIGQSPGGLPVASWLEIDLNAYTDNVALSRGDPENICYARSREYTMLVNVTSSKNLNDASEIRLYLDYNTTNATFCYNWTNDTFFKLQDHDGHVQLITDHCNITTDFVENWWLNFTFHINFTFPHEGMVDCFVNTTSGTGRFNLVRFPWLFRVENDLEFSGTPKLTARYQGELEAGDWVRGNESITVEDLTVHYQGAPNLIPEDDFFDVRVMDRAGNKWWDNQSSGESIFINITTRNVIDPDEEILITVENIMDSGICTSNLTFPLKIDAQAPLPPDEIKTYAYGKTSPFTKYPTINITWKDSADNASGLKGYYYSDHDNSFTSNGTFTDLTEGEIRGLNEGFNNIFVWCEDMVGNIGPAFSVPIQVDLTGVSFSNFTPSDSIWQNQSTLDCSVEISDHGGTGVDGSSIFYSISTAGPRQFSSWVPVWVPEDGILLRVESKCKFDEGDDNYIKWKAMDLAENDFVESEPRRILIDTSPVEFSETLTSIRSWYLYREIPSTIEVWDTGDSGVDQNSVEVRYSVTGENDLGPWMAVSPDNITAGEKGRWQVTASFRYLPGSENFIQFRCTDTAGNPMVYSKRFNLRIDTAGVEFGDFIIEDTDELPEVECSIRLSDRDSGVDVDSIFYSVSTEGDIEEKYGEWQAPSPMNIITGNPFMVYCTLTLEWGRQNYVRFKADDVVGWEEVISPSYRMNVTSEPVARISRPENRRTEFRDDQIVELDGSGSSDLDGDDLTFVWSSNISGFLGNNSTLFIYLEPGNHTITLTVTDADNNTAQKDILVDIKSKTAAKKEDDDTTETETGGISSGEGCMWWWIVIAAVVFLLILLLIFLILRRRKKKSEEDEKPVSTPSPQQRKPAYPYPYQQQQRPPQYQGGPAPQQSVYPPRYNMNQPQRPGLPGLAPQYPALPQHAGPQPSPTSKRHGIPPPAPPSESQQLPPPKEAPPQYQLPSFSTAEGEQDLNRMALPPAPDEVDSGPHEHTKELKKASPLPPPGMEEAQEGSPEEEEKEEEKEKSSPSLDSVFSGLTEAASDFPPPPSSPEPSPTVPREEEPPEPKVDEPKTLQCHSCSREYQAIIESFPSVVQCPYCGAQGMIESL